MLGKGNTVRKKFDSIPKSCFDTKRFSCVKACPLQMYLAYLGISQENARISLEV